MTNTSNKHNIGFDAASLIVAYFTKQLPKQNEYYSCYINVMNNKKFDDKQFKSPENVYVRKLHGFAHISVLSFSKPTETGFREFNNRKYFYVTKEYLGKVQLREDLLTAWGSSDVSNVSVLVLDTEKHRVLDIKVRDLMMYPNEQSQSDTYNMMRTFDIPESKWTYINTDADEEQVKGLMHSWTFLGNAKYNKYEARTTVKVISYKNGNRSKEVYFKSIKQAYDALTAAGFDMSYKTFQRRCNAEKPSLIETERFTFYVTKYIDFTGPDTL